MIGLTRRQRDCLEIIKRYQQKNGYMPSFRDIADGLHISTKSRVHTLITALVERGHVRHIPAHTRTLEIIEDKACPNCGHPKAGE
jgi:repressor LexA